MQKIWVVPCDSERLSDDVEMVEIEPAGNTADGHVAARRVLREWLDRGVETTIVVSETRPVVNAIRARAVAQQIANKAQALADGVVLAGHTLDWSRQVQELASEMRQFYYDAYGDLPASGPLNLRPSARR